ncbi:HAMP domain-containing methyl-accepting chemotaxis protein [Desertibaculum subflavum]|uniref:HAMP domain-containing methyl-accepting chemotaxis protein n=1 Tax=Desertibaculum subflavum TaxID=2268458 RepID=UPI0013C48A8B
MTIRTRLFVLLGVLGVLMIALAGGGAYIAASSRSALSTIVEDRVKPLRDLKIVADMYAVNIVDTTHKLRSGAMTAAEAIKAVEAARSRLTDRWGAYAATYMVGEEQRLATAAKQAMGTADAAAQKLIGLARSKDGAPLSAFADKELYPAIDPVSDVIGKLVDLQIDVSLQEYEAADATATKLTNGLIAVVIFGFFIMGGAVLMVVRTICRPIDMMTEAMLHLADRDWATEVPARDRGDEIGQMAQAVQVFKDNGIEGERLQAEAQAAEARQREMELEAQRERERLAAEAAAETTRKLRELEAAMKQAEADRLAEQEKLRAEAEAKRKQEMNALADAFDASVKQVVQTVGSAATQVQSSSTSMSATAEETTRQAAAVAAASEQASANVQTVASASEELSASINEIARQVAQSAQIANQASDRARATGATVDGLAQAASKIGEVVGLITSIASQTNLLALNATIEAARAGEAGKGFAVVASEVKSLANQTAKATEEISRQIGAVQGATLEAVGAIQGIGKTIEEINHIATSIASAVEEQTSATKEISRNVQEASTGTVEVSRNIGGVSQAANETGEGAAQMKGAADELSRQAATLATEVDGFIARIRAA